MQIGDLVVYKECYKCQIFYPAKLKDPNPYCPAHQEEWMKSIALFKRTRNIHPGCFDVYDILKRRLCRACGKLLLNKDGKPTKGYWGCSIKCREFTWKYYWPNLVYNYYRNRHLKGEPKCEQCGATRTDQCKNDLELHHKIPVHTLDHTNYMLIWDYENLILLCRKCHGKAHQKPKLEVPVQSFVTLDKFIKKGTKNL